MITKPATPFHRINQPRVEKITAMIATIVKSARSQRAGDTDVTALLAPVSDQLAVLFERDIPTPPLPPHRQPADASPPMLPLTQAPHHHRIAVFVDALPRDHLPSYLTHIANRLCDGPAEGQADG